MTTTRRTRTLAKVASAGAGLGLAAVAVLGFSNAAFSAKADNGGNNWAAGKDASITLTPNAAQTAPLFSFGLGGAPKPQSDGVAIAKYDNYLTSSYANLNDSDSDTGRDLTVTYTGMPAAQVRMYVDTSAATITPGLADHTLVTVKRGATNVYTDVPLSSLPKSFGEAGDAAGTDEANHWDIAPDSSGANTKYTVQIKSDGSAADGATAKGVKFVWEAQNV
jgi:hypothetical protein